MLSGIERATLLSGPAGRTLDASGFTLGSVALDGYGGSDELIGSPHTDFLAGGVGNDTLTGRWNPDFFVFRSSSEGVDTITDFGFAGFSDKFQVYESGFGGGLSAGPLATNQLAFGMSATTADHRFVYHRASGAVYFDADGVGGSAQVQIATLQNKPFINAASFVVV